MADKLWKAHERRTARALGGVRVPVNGRGDQPDIEHPLLSIECKERKTLPAWIEHALRQAEAAATGDRLAVAILHEMGRRHSEDLCLMRLSVLRELLAKANRSGAEG